MIKEALPKFYGLKGKAINSAWEEREIYRVGGAFQQASDSTLSKPSLIAGEEFIPSAKQCPLLKCKRLFLEEEGITSLTRALFLDHFQLCQQALGMSAHRALREKEHQGRKETGNHTQVRGTVGNLQ